MISPRPFDFADLDRMAREVGFPLRRVLDGAGGALAGTGIVGVETALKTWANAIPANALGPNGVLMFDGAVTRAGTGSPIVRVKYGGTTFRAMTISNNTAEFRFLVQNANSVTAQKAGLVTLLTGGLSSLAPLTGAVNSANAQSVQMTVEHTQEADTLTLQRLAVWSIYGA